ncbi:hypothetical protein [Streptomyces sp. NPDC058374]|uniref:hypothetical protein n=1 Tax=unclassified Streptomyces TaxID=2593676 RepID=UPI0036473282
MTGTRPPRKFPFRKRRGDGSPSPAVSDGERGLGASLEAENTADGAPGPQDGGTGTGEGPSTSLTSTPAPGRVAAVRDGLIRHGRNAKAGLGILADRVIEIAPRVPVRDLHTLREQFPGLGPEQLADRLINGAAHGTSTVGASVGAAAMLPVPPAMPAELAAEITAVAAIEIKLIAELHEVYGQRPEGGPARRAAAYLTSWTHERGIDVIRPLTVTTALSGPLKRELRQQITKRMIRNLPNLVPFMVGAAVGAVMNRRDTRKLAERVRKDLRAAQVPWDRLTGLPPLEKPGLPPVAFGAEEAERADRPGPRDARDEGDA